MRETMVGDRERRDLSASDVRVPLDLGECELALELVRDRIESIETDLATKDGSTFPSPSAFETWRAKAERARAVWEAKERDLLYSKRVLSSSVSPEVLKLQTRVLSLVGELHRTSARLAMLADGVDLPAPLRSYIDARKAQLPPGYYDDYLREWEAGPCG